jgi:ABC-type phosphate/phosphonate transport system substrate-binding protein
MSVIVLAAITIAVVCIPVAAGPADAPLRVGILANKGIDECVASWQPTVDYLNTAVPGQTFVLVPLTFENITSAAAAGEVDFILANPGVTAQLEAQYGASNILTMNTWDDSQYVKEFGGVIITKSNRTDIRSYGDLKGKHVFAAGKNSFGGYYSVLRELRANGIDPDSDFASLKFSDSHTAVVTGVLAGEADAGIVRTGTLEQMAEEGKISISDFSIFPHPAGNGTGSFPYVYSTRLYPEWPLTKLSKTDDDASSAVVVALLKITPDHPAAKAARMGRWTVPVNYQSVHDCLKEIGAPPYDNPVTRGPVTSAQRSASWVAGAAGAIAVVAILLAAVRYSRKE